MDDNTSSEKIHLRILSCFENESSFKKNSKFLIDRIGYSDKNVVLATVDKIKKTIKDKKEESEKKFWALLLLKECMDTKSPEIVAYVQKKILKRLVLIAKGERANIFHSKTDPLIVNRFIQLLLECLMEWSNAHGIDPNNKSTTQYRKAYQDLVSKKIKFPSIKLYFKSTRQSNQEDNSDKSVSTDISYVNTKNKQNPNNFDKKIKSISSDQKKKSNFAKNIQITDHNSITNNGANNMQLDEVNNALNQIEKWKGELKNILKNIKNKDIQAIKSLIDNLTQVKNFLESSINSMLLQLDNKNKEEIINKVMNEITSINEIIASYVTFSKNKDYQAFTMNVSKILKSNEIEVLYEPPKIIYNDFNSVALGMLNKPSQLPQKGDSTNNQFLMRKSQNPEPSTSRKIEESSFNFEEVSIGTSNQIPSIAIDTNNFGFGFETAPNYIVSTKNQDWSSNFQNQFNSVRGNKGQIIDNSLFGLCSARESKKKIDQPQATNSFLFDFTQPEQPKANSVEDNNKVYSVIENNPSIALKSVEKKDLSSSFEKIENSSSQYNPKVDPGFAYDQPGKLEDQFVTIPGIEFTKESKFDSNKSGNINNVGFNGFWNQEAGSTFDFKRTDMTYNGNEQANIGFGFDGPMSEVFFNKPEIKHDNWIKKDNSPSPKKIEQKPFEFGFDFNEFKEKNTAPNQSAFQFTLNFEKNEGKTHDNQTEFPNKIAEKLDFNFENMNHSSKNDHIKSRENIEFGFESNHISEIKSQFDSSSNNFVTRQVNSNVEAVNTNIENIGLGLHENPQIKNDFNPESSSLNQSQIGFDFNYEANIEIQKKSQEDCDKIFGNTINSALMNMQSFGIPNSDGFGIDFNEQFKDEIREPHKLQSNIADFNFGFDSFPKNSNTNFSFDDFSKEKTEKGIDQAVSANNNSLHQENKFYDQNDQLNPNIENDSKIHGEIKESNQEDPHDSSLATFSEYKNQDDQNRESTKFINISKINVENTILQNKTTNTDEVFIEPDINQKILIINQSLEENKIIQLNQENEILCKERDRLNNEIDDLNKVISKIQSDYQDLSQENENIFKENHDLKNELNETKKSLNEYALSIEKLQMETENNMLIKEKLTILNQEYINQLEELNKEYQIIKEKLNETDSSQRKIKSEYDNYAIVIDKLLNLAKDRIILIEDQNRLLTRDYFDLWEEIMNKKFKSINETKSFILERLYKKMNDYLSMKSDFMSNRDILTKLSFSKNAFSDYIQNISDYDNLDINSFIFQNHEVKNLSTDRITEYLHVNDNDWFEMQKKINEIRSMFEENKINDFLRREEYEQIQISEIIENFAYYPQIKLQTLDSNISHSEKNINDMILVEKEINSRQREHDDGIYNEKELKALDEISQKFEKKNLTNESFWDINPQNYSPKLNVSETQNIFNLNFEKSHEKSITPDNLSANNLSTSDGQCQPLSTKKDLLTADIKHDLSCFTPSNIEGSINSKENENLTTKINIIDLQNSQIEHKTPSPDRKIKDLGVPNKSEIEMENNQNNKLINMKDNTNDYSLDNVLQRINLQPNIAENQINITNNEKNHIENIKKDLNHLNHMDSPKEIQMKLETEEIKNNESNLIRSKENNNYTRIINYSSSLFSKYLTENINPDTFKYSCLVNKAAIYDSPTLQVGLISKLEAHLNNPNDKLARFTLHYGNKSPKEILNFSAVLSTSLKIRIYPQSLQTIIASRQQIKQEYIISFNDYSTDNHSILSVSFMHSNQNYHLNILLPLTINKFFEYKSNEKELFETKWKQNKFNTIKIKNCLPNSKLFKSETDIYKYFNNNIIDITPLNSKNKKKFGCIIELPNKNEYLIKLILNGGNSQIKINSENSNIEDSEHILQTLCYLLTN